MELIYLWIEGSLPKLQQICIKSYIKLGYKIFFYTFTKDQIGIDHKNIIFKDAGEVLERTYENHYHYSDLFRYKILHEQGGTWIDADLFLFRKIPNMKTIISSEHCNKKGAYKKLYTNKNPNIGILKFEKDDPLLKQTIIDCEKSKAKLENLSFMKNFRKNIIRMKRLNDVVEPQFCCPVSWANYKELFSPRPLDYKFKSKYGMNTDTWSNIVDNSIGIHLWNTFYVNNKCIILQDSPVFRLEEMVKDIDINTLKVKFCVPTYKRYKQLKNKTLALLDSHYINPEDIYIFVENVEEYREYQKTLDKNYNIIITSTKGIGQKRNFIRNYFVDETKILMIDDDVEDILEFINKKESRSVNNFKSKINYWFDIIDRENVSMFGVLLHDNPFFGSKNYSKNLKFIGGTLQGLIINKNVRDIVVDIDHFEDVEFSLKHFIKEGKTIRFNNIGLKTKYYQKEGGIVAHKGSIENREEEAWNNATYLLGNYPNNVNLYLKKDGKLNIKLK